MSDSWSVNMWPVAIVKDRYGGTYSGGLWLAFNSYRAPNDVFGDDITCSDYWAGGCTLTVGKGNTPDSALDDLYRQVFSHAKD